MAPQDGVDGTHLSGLPGESHSMIHLAELAWQLASIKKSSRNDAFIIFITNPPKISHLEAFFGLALQIIGEKGSKMPI